MTLTTLTFDRRRRTVSHKTGEQMAGNAAGAGSGQ